MLKRTGMCWFCVLAVALLMRNPVMAKGEELPDKSRDPHALYERLQWNVGEYFADFFDEADLCMKIEERNTEMIDRALGVPSPEEAELIRALNKLNNKDEVIEDLRPGPPVDINVQGVDNVTPLMWSLASDYEIFEHLLKRGANPNIAYIGLPSRMKVGNTVHDTIELYGERMQYGERYLMLRAIAMHCIRNSTVVEIVAAHPDSRWLKAALENGWDPSFRPGYALDVAARNGCMENFWLLIEAGADINQCGASFENVFYEAPEELIPVLEKLTDEHVRRRILDVVTMPLEELWKDDARTKQLSSQHWRRGRQRLLDALVTQGVDPVKYWEEYQEWKKTSDSRSQAERYGGPYDEREMFRNIIENPIMIPFEVPRLPNRTLTGKQGVP